MDRSAKKASEQASGQISGQEMVERLRRWAKRDDVELVPSSSAIQIDGSLLRDSGFANGCVGKKRYDNEDEATEFLHRPIASARRSKQEGMHAYLCVFCDGWHLGH